MKPEEFLKTKSGAYVLRRLLKIASENRQPMSVEEAIQFFKKHAVIEKCLGIVSCGLLYPGNLWVMGWHPLDVAEELRHEGVV